MPKIGEVVFLNSGGPAMTVTEILAKDNPVLPGQVGVKWFSNGQLAASTFPPDALTDDDPVPAMQAAQEAALSDERSKLAPQPSPVQAADKATS